MIRSSVLQRGRERRNRPRSGPWKWQTTSGGRAIDRGYARVLGEMAQHVDIVGQHLPCRGLPTDQSRDAREDVEGAIGLQALDAGDSAQQVHHAVPACLEETRGVRHTVLRTVECHDCSGLADRACAGGALSQQQVERLDQFGWTCAISDAPPGESIGLRQAIDDERSVAQFLRDIQGRQVPGLAIDEVLIDFVREKPYVRVLEQDLAQGLELTACVHRSGRIARRIEDEPACPRRDRRTKRSGFELETLLGRARHDDRLASLECHHVRIGHPVRGRDDHFIPGIQ